MEKLFLVYGRTGFYDVGNWGTEDFDEAKPLGIFDNFGEAMDRFRESVREAWNCLKEDCFYTPDDPLYKTTEDDLFVDWNTDKDDYDEMELCWKHFESDNYAE